VEAPAKVHARNRGLGVRSEAASEQIGTDAQQLEKLRAAKAEERGGFADRVIWSGNRPADAAIKA
jgi:hypothetical protein